MLHKKKHFIRSAFFNLIRFWREIHAFTDKICENGMILIPENAFCNITCGRNKGYLQQQTG